MLVFSGAKRNKSSQTWSFTLLRAELLSFLVLSEVSPCVAIAVSEGANDPTGFSVEGGTEGDDIIVLNLNKGKKVSEIGKRALKGKTKCGVSNAFHHRWRRTKSCVITMRKSYVYSEVHVRMDNTGSCQ